MALTGILSHANNDKTSKILGFSSFRPNYPLFLAQRPRERWNPGSLSFEFGVPPSGGQEPRKRGTPNKRMRDPKKCRSRGDETPIEEKLETPHVVSYEMDVRKSFSNRAKARSKASWFFQFEKSGR